MENKNEQPKSAVERLNKEREGKGKTAVDQLEKERATKGGGHFKSGGGFDPELHAKRMKEGEAARNQRMLDNQRKYEEAAKNKITKSEQKPKKGLVAKAKESIRKVKDAFGEAKKEIEKDLSSKSNRESSMQKQQQQSQQQQSQHKPSVLQQKAQEQLRVRKTQESKPEIAKTQVVQKQAVQKSTLQQKAQQLKSSSSPKRVTVKAPPTKGRSK